MSERRERVAERIRGELMEMLLRGDLKDPGARGAVVHAVVVSGDLRHAKVYVRLGELDASEARRAALLRGLGRAKGYIKRQLAERLGLRYTPEIVFLWDEAADRATRIDAILDELAGERGG